MNIMLVSVTERTREIGLRMALGARRFDITLQFLVEAVTLCVLGGLIGIAAGIGAAHLTAGMAEWPILIAPETILPAIAAAGGAGIVFGYLPARRAGRLNPIDALRSERDPQPCPQASCRRLTTGVQRNASPSTFACCSTCVLASLRPGVAARDESAFVQANPSHDMSYLDSLNPEQRRAVEHGVTVKFMCARRANFAS